MRRLGVIAAIAFPRDLDSRVGDTRTWADVRRHCDGVVVIAQTDGPLPRIRRSRAGVVYVLAPKLPRALDLVAFPLWGLAWGLALWLTGVRVWAASDPLRAGIVCLALGLLPGTRTVVHLQAMLLRVPGPRFGRLRPLVEAVSRFVARRADRVRVMTEGLAADAQEEGVPPERIHIASSRVDLARFEVPGPPARSAGSPVVLGFLGTLNASKGLDVLLEAFQQVSGTRAVRLRIAGGGPLAPMVEAAAVADGAIEALGPLDGEAVPGYLRSLDIVVVPSYDEGLPRVLLEAMATGLPVVASRVGGIPEAIEDGINGILVEPGDPSALATALTGLVDDPSLRPRLGEAAHRTVAHRYAWDRGIEALVDAHFSEHARG